MEKILFQIKHGIYNGSHQLTNETRVKYAHIHTKAFINKNLKKAYKLACQGLQKHLVQNTVKHK